MIALNEIEHEAFRQSRVGVLVPKHSLPDKGSGKGNEPVPYGSGDEDLREAVTRSLQDT